MERQRLPWWTWVLPFFIFALGSQLSLYYQVAPATSVFYFPVAIALAMIQWWGPRVLIGVFLNALVHMPLWGLEKVALFPLYALPETLEVAISWILVREQLKGKDWSPTPRNIILFGIHGIAIPATFMAFSLQGVLFLAGEVGRGEVLAAGLQSWLGDLLGGVCVSLPLVIALSPWLDEKRLSRLKTSSFELKWGWSIPFREKVLLSAGFIGSLILSVSVPLSQSWYLFGLFLMISAIWYGLEFAILVNTWILLVGLALPPLLNLVFPTVIDSFQITGTLITICYCALIAGSAISAHRGKIIALRETEFELKTARDQAQAASRAKSDFLARMSHEIRTPLNSVLGMLELLRETQLTTEQSRYLTLFSHAGENLKALINDLLDFAKIEAKALNVECVSYDLHGTVRSVFEILQIKAEEKGLKFELSLSDDVPRYQLGDPTRLRQILFNLIGNALKFTNEGEVLVILRSSEASPNELIIEIQDTGIGIPREKQKKLFNPFYQADSSTTRKYGGTGLGLVISKNLVEIMGGTIELKSLKGRGTTFQVCLPNRPDPKGHLEVKKPTTFTWPSHLRNRIFRILLVDDSEDNRVLMIHYLKNLPFKCDEAVNGQEAVDLCENNDYDLIFMDMQMPILSGYKATEIIRHHENMKGKRPIPIIALTATAVIEDLHRALEAGCNSYLVKPVKKVEILETLAHSLTTNTPENSARTEPPSASI